jgi:methionyl-tRNA formyltransferase
VSKVRICFLGTPEFAVTCLKGLLQDEHYEIVGVVTQPDRPAGRKMVLQPTPVKSFAAAKGLRVISPESVNKELFLQEIQRWGAEIAVVVAFGQILSQKFLDSFRFGAVNIHASLLPRWRGAGPIQRAIQMGDKESGVTLQKIVKELDAGDVIGLRKCLIPENMTAQGLHDELASLSTELLHIELMDYLRGNLAPVPQDASLATYAKKIDKAEAELKWQEPAEQLHNKIRAFVMGPGTWTTFRQQKLKVHKSEIYSRIDVKQAPGTLMEVSDKGILVATSLGSLSLLEVQPESRNRMNIAEFVKGYSPERGEKLG